MAGEQRVDRYTVRTCCPADGGSQGGTGTNRRSIYVGVFMIEDQRFAADWTCSGAIACLMLERLFAEHLLASWRSRTTSFVLGVAPVVAVL
jgi:hypothetical protein